MAAASGMTSAITNPLEPEIMSALRAADVMNGVDKNCRTWISLNSGHGNQGGMISEARAKRREGRRRS